MNPKQYHAGCFFSKPITVQQDQPAQQAIGINIAALDFTTATIKAAIAFSEIAMTHGVEMERFEIKEVKGPIILPPGSGNPFQRH